VPIVSDPILAAHGITEKQAFNVVAVFFTETWPRILMARRLHKIDKLKTIVSHIRCIPWPHVDAYNQLLEKIAKARTSSELRVPLMEAKEPIIRRLNHNRYIFNRLDVDHDRFATAKLSAAEKTWARQIIFEVMQVGPDGEPKAGRAVPWFGEWEPESW